MKIPVGRIAIVAAAALAVAGVVVLLRPDPIRVDVATARRGPLQVTVDEEGYTRVRDRFVVTAPITGRVARLVLDAGDAVDRGAVVARMEPLPLDPRARAQALAVLEAALATQREAESRVAHAEAALAQAQRSAGRARRLRATETVSAQELELAELEETARQKDRDAAAFAARTAAANVDAARAALMTPGTAETSAAAACEAQAAACVEVRAPAGGRVLRIPEKSERVAAAGTPLLEIGDPSALEVVVDVLSADAVKVRPGALMLIEDWGGSGTLKARVRTIEPSGFTKLSALGVEEQRVNVIADFVDPPGPLADGYRVETRTVIWQADDVLQVPSSALFRRQGAWSVFVIDGARAQRRTVEIGERNAHDAQVLGGLDDGAVVVLHPSDTLADGARVEPL